MKKYIALLLALLLCCLMLTGCQQEVSSTPKWETTSASLSDFTFEVPKSWTVWTEDGMVLLSPPGENSSTGLSNVNILIAETGIPAATPTEMSVALEQNLPQQIAASGMGKISGLLVSEFTAPIGNVCSASFDITVEGFHIAQRQYYPLVDQYSIVVSASDLGDKCSPPPKEVAEHLINTLEKSN